MFLKRGSVLVFIAVCGLGLVAHTSVPTDAEAGVGASAPVLKADQLTAREFRQQLKGLPDSAVVEYKGQRITVGEIRARAKQTLQAAAAKMQAAARQGQAQVEARRAQLDQQHQAKLQADGAKAMVEFTRLALVSATPQARQLEAIQQEAAQLLQRSKTASPAERAQIEHRAGQLLQQLQQMGR